MQALRCDKCRKFIAAEAGGITDGGLWFHTACYKIVVAQKIAFLERQDAYKLLSPKQVGELQRLYQVRAAL